MAFALLDDQIQGHPKFARAGVDAIGLWTLCLSHCSAFLTDGYIARATAERFAGARLDDLAEKLVTCGDPGEAGLWDVAEGGWVMHDYLDWNPSASKVKSKRKAERVRKEKGRKTQGRDAGGRVTSARNPSGHPTEGAARPEHFHEESESIPVPVREESAAGHTGSHAHAHSHTQKNQISLPPPARAYVDNFESQQRWSEAWEMAKLPGHPLLHAVMADWRRLPDDQRMTPEECCALYQQLVRARIKSGCVPNVGAEHLLKSLPTLVQLHRGEVTVEKLAGVAEKGTRRALPASTSVSDETRAARKF